MIIYLLQLEEKLKRDRQEAEKLKLIELQKKTPEVTITVVDPQKPVPQRLLPQCNLPEVSILPTSPPVALPTVKQLSNKKKDKQEVCSNSSNTSSSSCSSSSSSTSSINSKTKTAPVNTNVKNKSISKAEKLMISGQVNNKAAIKSDKAEVSNKSNKIQTNNSNSTNVKNNAMDKSLTVDLDDKNLTKKERKKLKKKMKKMEEVKAKEETKKPVQTETQPQIVTIKRVMESNSAEPTVTITLKGQTPAEDKVLFTLVNGQTKEVTSLKLENEQSQNVYGKKKKTKANNNNNNNNNTSNNNNNSLQQGNKQQQTNNSKQQTQNKICDSKNNMKQQSNNEKSKGKQVDEKKIQQQNITEIKTKSKKDKKNIENKENVLQQNVVNKNKNQSQNVSGKKQNKVNTPPQTPVSQKPSQNFNINIDNKKAKIQSQERNGQLSSNKSSKNTSASITIKQMKGDNQKIQSKLINQTTIKQRQELHSASTERINSPLSSQFKDIGANSKINIENLKLPPGITITKVDAPAKPLPIRSAPLPKPVNPPKQTTIIAAPMSGVQSSYASSQAGGNVIVVDTGKLKQDLLPKPAEKGEIINILYSISNISSNFTSCFIIFNNSL